MLTPAEQTELLMLEALRKSTGLSLSQSGRYDWLKWGKADNAKKQKAKDNDNA